VRSRDVRPHVALCLDWSPDQTRALTECGAEVTCVVTAADRHAPAAAGHTGRVLVVGDPADLDQVLGALGRAGLTPRDFTAVGTDDEFALVTAAVLAELGGAAGLRPPVALALRDKEIQKRLVRAAGLPVAGSAVVADLAEVADTGLRPPLVVKPPAGAGCQRTWVVPDDAAVRRLAEHAERVGPWLVEEFVPGEELHVDGAVRGGEVRLVSVGRYLANLIGLRDGGVLLGSTTPDPDQEVLLGGIDRLTRAALAALGHTDGVFHLEVFHDDGRLVFGECAGRIGGGMIFEAVLAKHGVDLNREWAAAVLGRPPAPASTRPPTAGSFGWINLQCPAGRIEHLPDLAELAARPGVVAAQQWKDPGDVVGDPTGGSHVLVAKAMVHAVKESQARADLTAVADWFAGQVRVTA
jgi:biotin carboxylase